MRNQIIKLCWKLMKLGAPYPLGEYDYYETTVKNNEVYHGMDGTLEDVRKVILQGYIPTGELGRGAVCLGTDYDEASRFGNFTLVLDWECLQSKNLNLKPLRYLCPTDIAINESLNNPTIQKLLNSGIALNTLKLYTNGLLRDDEVAFEQFCNEFENSSVTRDELNTLTGYLHGLGTKLKDKYPYIYHRQLAYENEIRSYLAVFIDGCVKYILESDDSIEGGNKITIENILDDKFIKNYYNYIY